MDITSYSRERIRQGLDQGRRHHQGTNENIRVLFAPTNINEQNFERACNIYSRIEPENYDTVVVVESYDQVLDKKIPMASNRYFETSLGKVEVNDYLRNEFCDEDDDFYIFDEAFSRDISLFHQLMMLQCVFDDFSILSVQIADNGPSIVKELAYVLSEVLASRNALIVFCCELANERQEEFEKVKMMVDKLNQSRLLNYLNSGESHIVGATTFIAGILVADNWELKLNFLNGKNADYAGSLLTGFAERQKVLF